MGIQLDWDLESDAGREVIEEDPAVIAARTRREKRTRIILSAALCLTILISAGGWWRVHTVERRMRRMLDSTVQAEALALRIGDRRGFLDAQAPNDDWRAFQDYAFRAFQGYEGRVEIAGEVVSVEMTDSEAQVVIRQMLDGQAVDTTWYYTYLDDIGWRHHASEPEPWMYMTITQPGYTLTYAERDAKLAEEVRTVMERWAEQATALTWDEALTPIPIEIRWEKGYETRMRNGGFVIATYHEDGEVTTLTDAMQADLAALTADQWSQGIVSKASTNFHHWTLRDIRILLHHAFDPDQPPSYFLGSLNVAFGDGTSGHFIRLQQDGVTAEAAVTVISQTASEPVDLNEYLTHYLRAEAAWNAAYPNGGLRHFSAANFGRYQVAEFYEADIASIEVIRTHTAGGYLWAETLVTAEGNHAYFVNIPFIQIEGVWQHSAYDGYFFAQESVEGEFITLRFDEVDREAAEAALPLIEAAYIQVIKDFNAGEPIPLSIKLGDGFWVDGEDWMAILSPHWLGHPVMSGSTTVEVLRDAAVSTIMANLLGDSYNFAHQTALMMWQAEQMGIGYYDVFWGQPTAIAQAPTSMDTLWDNQDSWLDVLGYKVLIDLLVEEHGTHLIPELFDAFQHGNNTDAYISLRAINGASLEEYEDEWLSRLTDELTARGYQIQD